MLIYKKVIIKKKEYISISTNLLIINDLKRNIIVFYMRLEKEKLIADVGLWCFPFKYCLYLL